MKSRSTGQEQIVPATRFISIQDPYPNKFCCYIVGVYNVQNSRDIFFDPVSSQIRLLSPNDEEGSTADRRDCIEAGEVTVKFLKFEWDSVAGILHRTQTYSFDPAVPVNRHIQSSNIVPPPP